MHAFDLALKDIRQVLRDRKSLVFLLIMPVVFTFFFGFVFNSGGEENPRVKIGIINQDADGMLSSILVDMLETSDTVRPVLISESDAADLDSQIVRGELAAGLRIPAGFSTAALYGEERDMELVINEETDAGQTVRRALQTYITRVMGIARIARSSADAFAAVQGGFSDEAARAAYMQDAVQRAVKAWKNNPLSIQSENSTNNAASSDPLAQNPYNQFSPGMIVQFVFFGLIQSALVMVLERKNGAMARLLTTPMTKAELIGGHILGMFTIFFVQQLLLVLFGQVVLKVDYLRQPAAVLLVMVALSLWVASSGLLISALVKKEEQVALYSLIGMFLISGLGGAWFSLEMVGKTFATVGHLMPSAWAIDGFQNIVVRGLGFESVLLPVAIMLAYAAVFFGISIWRFRYE